VAAHLSKRRTAGEGGRKPAISNDENRRRHGEGWRPPCCLLTITLHPAESNSGLTNMSRGEEFPEWQALGEALIVLGKDCNARHAYMTDACAILWAKLRKA